MEYNNYSQINNNNNNNYNIEKNHFHNDNEDNNNIIEDFKYFDINNNGRVNIYEIKQLLTSFGDKMTEEEFDKIIKSIDVNIDDNGFIDYLEFIKLWKSNE